MNATLQTLLMLLLVLACTTYSAWTLMPAALRRTLAVALLRLRWAAHVPAINRAAAAPAGCGCDGCDRSPLAGNKGAQEARAPLAQGSSVIRIVPGPKARSVNPR